MKWAVCLTASWAPSFCSLASPLMASVALAVKLDSPGPVLFRQKRFGFNNERIDVFKFRSLYHDQADPLATKVVTKNDSRVTRVGRFIRKSSLDELPRAVQRGSSRVPSRQFAPARTPCRGKLQSRLFDEAVDGYFRASPRQTGHYVGWAQINGWRGEVDSEEKIQKRARARSLLHRELVGAVRPSTFFSRSPLALMTKNENAY